MVAMNPPFTGPVLRPGRRDRLIYLLIVVNSSPWSPVRYHHGAAPALAGIVWCCSSAHDASVRLDRAIMCRAVAHTAIHPGGPLAVSVLGRDRLRPCSRGRGWLFTRFRPGVMTRWP